MSDATGKQMVKVVMGEMEMTPVGIRPGGLTSKKAILAHMMSLDFYQIGINWCVGDLILRGEQKFGEDWIIQALADHMSSMSPETLKQCRWVAERYPHGQRLTELTWTHHLVTAGLKDEDERLKLLESCLAPSKDAPDRGPGKPMTVTDLRKVVKATKAGTEAEEEAAGVKLLDDAKRAIERLEYPERIKLGEWMESKSDEWAKIEMKEYGHGTEAAEEVE